MIKISITLPVLCQIFRTVNSMRTNEFEQRADRFHRRAARCSIRQWWKQLTVARGHRYLALRY